MVLVPRAAYRRRRPWVVRRLVRRLRQASRRRLLQDRLEWLRPGCRRECPECHLDRLLRRPQASERRPRWPQRLRHLRPWGLAGHLRLRRNTAECRLVRLQVRLDRLQVLRLLLRRRLPPRRQLVEFPARSRSSPITAANDSS